jgi:ABC-2 type transport system ATP-binding protein
MDKTIEINNLSKEYKVLNRKEGFKGAILNLFSQDYKYIKAINNVSMEIFSGEILGILGRNGAGKSTLIKMMTGVLKPSAGVLSINGNTPFKNRKQHASNIGIVFGQRSQLWWSLPCIESFKIIKEIYSINNDVYEENMKFFNELIPLNELMNKPVRLMSLGQRVLCDILASFLHNPKIVFLDEPTIGLDINVKDKIHKLILSLNSKKKTAVILTTHDMGDVDAVCKRIVIIDNGEKIYDDKIGKLKKYFGPNKTLLAHINSNEITDDSVVITNIKKLIDKHFQLIDHLSVECNNRWIKIVVDENQISVLRVLNLIQKEFDIDKIEIKAFSTEFVIKKIYESNCL